MMRNPNVETHAMYGIYTMYLAIALCIVRGAIGLWKKRDVGRNPLYLVVTLAAVVLVMYTAHLGERWCTVRSSPGSSLKDRWAAVKAKAPQPGCRAGRVRPGTRAASRRQTEAPALPDRIRRSNFLFPPGCTPLTAKQRSPVYPVEPLFFGMTIHAVECSAHRAG